MAELPGAPRRQFLLFAAIFGGIAAALAIGYFLFLRVDYAVMAQGLRPADAAAIVAELDKRAIAYRLRDGGSTILVPEDEADATRIAIAGSDAAVRGQTGFELFNKSDMGLTNFAQKINYQRALQGELVRTIAAMEGVDSARVHLALPERTLFRGARSEPSAAVTVAMKPGLAADPARVAGIQRLVAAAVPDLSEAKVVVLDASGRVISAAPAAATAQGELDERQAMQAYYAARVRAAVEPWMSGQKFAVRVLVLPTEAAAQPDAAAVDAVAWAPGAEGVTRSFDLRVLLVTVIALTSDAQARVRDAAAEAVGLDPARGDSLAFEVGPVEFSQAPPMMAVPPPTTASPPSLQEAPTAAPASGGVGAWLWVLPALFALGLAFWAFGRRRTSTMSEEDREAFAAKLRRQLNLSAEAGDASA